MLTPNPLRDPVGQIKDIGIVRTYERGSPVRSSGWIETLGRSRWLCCHRVPAVRFNGRRGRGVRADAALGHRGRGLGGVPLQCQGKHGNGNADDG
ncbi:hypothetical protein GCM10025778_07500 [Paeniglutamicibacter antarcticus]|uniref:Uncharacterized protein n=1 Tax=Paeniglutamicibacter antarcticus TaxID=494023 RepID=A0ABP9THI5_9MICC